MLLAKFNGLTILYMDNSFSIDKINCKCKKYGGVKIDPTSFLTFEKYHRNVRVNLNYLSLLLLSSYH